MPPHNLNPSTPSELDLPVQSQLSAPPDSPPVLTGDAERALSFIKHHCETSRTETPSGQERYIAVISSTEEQHIRATLAFDTEDLRFGYDQLIYCRYPPEEGEKSGQDRPSGKIPIVSFTHELSHESNFVVEIGYTQSESELFQNNATFLKQHKGEIRTAVAIKLQAQSVATRENREAGSACYVIIRYGDGNFKDRVVDIVDFRDKDGNVLDGNFDLRLSNFCPTAVVPHSDDPQADPHMLIPHDMLNTWVNQGQHSQRRMDRKSEETVETEKTSPGSVRFKHPADRTQQGSPAATGNRSIQSEINSSVDRRGRPRWTTRRLPT
ncbi:hypothetical protein OPT61_g1978 [Boeremia exigua]|uniref:Uncharacterized protein n=1 Tax=Boeremia exigua TaxID=749465 RepID=A0ACC2IN64_9PLEO|nr:hypothetical protein OPT61_g1978 [Boeremia exigua]